jgi:glycosyltransferase involved in cell wall biosynthesis
VALLPALSDRVNERAMVGASNKPFDYMAAGLTLLVPDAPAWRRTFVDAGFGLACDPESPVSIAGTVQCLLQQHSALAEIGRRGQEQIAREWNYETTFAPVMARLLDRGHESAAARGAA